MLHQEDAIAHISRCMEQVKGKKKTTPLGHGPYQHPMFKIEEKLFVNTHIIYIYIYIYTEPTNGKERSILDPSAPKWKDTSSNHTIDECY